MKTVATLSLVALATLASGHARQPRLAHFGQVDANDNDLVRRVIKQEYTHIVVGGGNSGLAVAARLSEDPSFSVLVLEAGTYQPATPGVMVPGLAGSTFQSDIDWAFFTQPQEHAKGRQVYWPRGKILGGSTALNFMAWTRGHKADYDGWAKMGAKGWTWKSLLPYFKKSEKFSTPGKNNQDVEPTYNAAVHGSSGPVQVSFSPYISEQFTGFYDGLRSMDVPVANDLNDGVMDGIAWSQSTIGKGGILNERRVTSQTAYIDPIWLIRSNLCVMTGMQATRVLFSDKKRNGLVEASGVEFTLSNVTTSLTFSAHATHEVVLSAGSIQTPQLLELSGIGNARFLKSKGVKPVVDLPGVGENLMDHPAVVVVQKLKSGSKTLDAVSANPALASEALAEWALGKGILTQELSTLAYLRSDVLLKSSDHRHALSLMNRLKSSNNIPAAQLEEQIAQVKAGSPVMEFLAINVYFGNSTGEANVPYLSLAACNQKSFSRGSIHIASNDPKAYPDINPNYLQAEIDRYYLVRGAMFLRELAKTDALSKYIEVEAEPGNSVQSEQDWEDWVESVVRTEYHPVGTAKMGPRREQGVVDEKLRVHGVANLRVVDLSVMPLHVSTHPQSTAYMIAEKASDLMRSQPSTPSCNH
ncbi:hypothetical protein JCM10212_006586 [Sporobolomyces blumeae]